MNEYKLTFTVTIEEVDDPAARQRAKDLEDTVGAILADFEVKLQEVHPDKPPRGVRMD